MPDISGEQVSVYQGQYITDSAGNKLPDGEGEIRYSSGFTRVGNFVNGVPDGQICVYDEDGIFYQMETFADGTITGPHIRLVDPTLGTFRYATYRNGDIEGNFTVVWEDGQWEQFYTERGSGGQQSTQRIYSGSGSPPGTHENICS